VRGDGHQIPPLDTSAAGAGFNGPVAGLGEVCGEGVEGTGATGGCDSYDRCGTMRHAHDRGSSPMCENTTDDGKLFLTLAEVEKRCAADPHCAGFSQDTKDGPAYFRPLAKITSIGADPKWTTWSKGPLPPAPPSPTPADWFDQVDVPFCLATEPSAAPPREPPKPPDVTIPACSSDTPVTSHASFLNQAQCEGKGKELTDVNVVWLSL
jgi:hypothetical protein